MVTAEERKPTMPEWCTTEFAGQIGALQTELEQCREQIKAATARADYITKIFKFCGQELDGFELSQPDSIERVTKVLRILGWESQPTSNQENLLHLNDGSETPVLLLVSTRPSPPDRSELGALILAQTELWEKTGVEAVQVILHSGATLPDDNLIQFAEKRQIAFLPLSRVFRKSAEVLLGELDPDDIRKSILVA